MNPLTEAQAWREVARRFVERDDRAAGDGLCIAVAEIAREKAISVARYGKMKGRVRSYMLADEHYAYPYPWSEHIDARALAALWLACEAEASHD